MRVDLRMERRGKWDLRGVDLAGAGVTDSVRNRMGRRGGARLLLEDQEGVLGWRGCVGAIDSVGGEEGKARGWEGTLEEAMVEGRDNRRGNRRREIEVVKGWLCFRQKWLAVKP